MNCIVYVGEGSIWCWFEFPVMHGMSSLSFVWHWHGMGAHVHPSSRSGIIASGALLSKFLALISVKN